MFTGFKSIAREQGKFKCFANYNCKFLFTHRESGDKEARKEQGVGV